MNMKRYTATKTAELLGVHRQTLIHWTRKGWIKPKRDYRNWPVFTEETIKEIREWREKLKD